MKCSKCDVEMKWTYDFEDRVCAPFMDDEAGYYYCSVCKKILYLRDKNESIYEK